MPILKYPKGNGESRVTWRTQDGRLIKVGELEYSHLLNIIEYLKKRMKAQAMLGKPHAALHTEMWLLLMLSEKDKRNNTLDATGDLKAYIADESEWPKFAPRSRYAFLDKRSDPAALANEVAEEARQSNFNDLYDEVFEFENKWGHG